MLKLAKRDSKSDGKRDPVLRLIGPPMAPQIELSRWLMQLHGVDHRFEPRAAGLSGRPSRRAGVTIEPPLILSDRPPVGGLKASIVALEERLQPADTLFPRDGDREFVEGLCNDLFPPAMKSFYAELLEVPAVLAPKASANVPFVDAYVVRHFFGAWRKMIRGGLKLEQFDVAPAAATITGIFDAIAAALGDRAFLDGAAAGTRDIAFAALASPVILPRAFPVALPAVEELPPAFRSRVEGWRMHPAGVHALAVYRQRAGIPRIIE